MPAVISDHQISSKYEAVIGLEVHVQLATHTKIFCGCPTSFGAAPNSNVCPVCLGLPGALPVLNKHAVELAIAASLAIGCKINPKSVFARKNYFYPDLPKGYQISQYDQPLAEHGHIDVAVDAVQKRIGVTRVHMEDDAGKSIHDGFKDSDRYTYVDLNRSGTPLIEIVSEPDIRSSDEAHAYLTELKQVMQYLNVSTCDMEKGHLRCDANVSVRLRGAKEFGTKAEVKNVNSFRFVKMAIDCEIARQIAVIEGGGKVIQESRLYNPDADETVSMRSKEHAHDYRYFPEPDLLPLMISDSWMKSIEETTPELPASRRQRFIENYGLREYDAQVLTATRPMSEYFEKTAVISNDARAAANWVMGDLSAVLKSENKEIEDSPVPPQRLGQLIALITSGKINGRMAKDIFPKMVETGDDPETIMRREGLESISDEGALVKIIDEVIAANPKQVEQYKGGKQQVIGFLVGQAMKASRGQADPAVVNRMMKERL